MSTKKPHILEMIKIGRRARSLADLLQPATNTKHFLTALVSVSSATSMAPLGSH